MNNKPLLREVSFDEIFQSQLRSMLFYTNKYAKRESQHSNIPGYDWDDIFQELAKKTFDVYTRIPQILPESMIYLDYRFSAFMNRVYYNHTISLWRSTTFIKNKCRLPKDALDHSIPIDDLNIQI